ncbi:short-chain dehydrogenase [Microbacterium sediminis]|uniref:Short-chain dehydrogenase n=2 Tax=Microbacterium sediminis TaxID=904291 RepID=A0A1B9NIQ3_9MICO|nr:short-chain dehydrogenase [Microbacterium sediminis]QBR75287.1 SDR family oxidoreductase [Microbacterium sediminis]
MIGRGLEGKVALVTGTAQGIGADIAEVLREEGATVYGIDRDQVDASDSRAVASYLEQIGGRVDVLVNCAGGVTGQVHKPIEDVTDEEWARVLQANLQTTFVMTRAVTPAMKAAGWGRIVNISSGAGRSVSLTGIQAYTSAKAAQIGFTRQMAHELGQFGITVNCVAPGFVRSNPTTEKQWASYGEEGQRALVQKIALRRTGTSRDIANGVRFFTSELADWVSGQVLSIDGGSSMF